MSRPFQEVQRSYKVFKVPPFGVFREIAIYCCDFLTYPLCLQNRASNSYFSDRPERRGTYSEVPVHGLGFFLHAGWTEDPSLLVALKFSRLLFERL